ncbi:MAG: DUF3394 domain-containing protein, partial [Candidatus Competibacterales bacterium]|nr:DUF3394 domain-containing protein [Candidatus Competibacterales bacterium]
FFYSLRTALLPFLFIFNTDLLLIDVDFLHGVLIFVVATIAMLLFSAALQGFFITSSRWYESVLLLLVAFTLFRPGFWMDRMFPPYEDVPPTQIEEVAAETTPGTELRLRIDGLDEFGEPISFVALLPIGEGETGEERLQNAGLELAERDGKLVVDNVAFDSPAQNAGLDWDQTITAVLKPIFQPWKELMYIPALVLLALIIAIQRRRRDTAAGQEMPASATT